MSNSIGSDNPGMDRDGLGITTLSIGLLAAELGRDKILSYFAVFGDVLNVRICSETGGFVTFCLAESAAKALRVDSHIISGRTVRIAAADDRHQDKFSLLNLNDDCMLEILLKKSLTLMDLCSVAETCRRLKRIAARVFKREHRKCDIRSLSGCQYVLTKRIFLNFGSEISDLQIRGEGKFGGWPVRVLAHAVEYCSQTLQSLDIQNFTIPQFSSENFLGTPFENLQKITLTYCDFLGASQKMFADCGSLVELAVKEYPGGNSFILEKTFPKLQQFGCEYEVDSDLLEPFIARHMNLKSLKAEYVKSSVLQVIAGCKQLETLKCFITEGATLDLSHLVHIRELVTNCSHQNVMTSALGVNKLKFLEKLTLVEAKIDSEFVQTLAQLPRLRVLKLDRCTGLDTLHKSGGLNQLTTLEICAYRQVDWDIVLLVQSLGQLNCLTVEVRTFQLDKETYLKIVDVVRQFTPNRSTLTFRLGSFRFSYDHLLPEFSSNAHLVNMIITRY